MSHNVKKKRPIPSHRAKKRNRQVTQGKEPTHTVTLSEEETHTAAQSEENRPKRSHKVKGEKKPRIVPESERRKEA